MKYLLIISMLLSLFGCKPGGRYDDRNRKHEGPIRYYEFNLSEMRMSNKRYYRLDCLESGEVKLDWTKYGKEISTIMVPQEVPEHINALVEEYQLYKLKTKPYLPPFHVLDGYMWHVYIGYEDGSISAHGDNAWPSENLRAGINAINDYLDTLLPEDSSEE